jgi:hypothetical protein
MAVSVRVNVLFSLVIITEGRVLAVRGPTNIHIESDGLHSSCTKLLALGLLLFVKRGRRCGGTNLDDFWKEQAGLGRDGGEGFDRFAAPSEAQRIGCHA